MKISISILVLIIMTASAVMAAEGTVVDYTVRGQSYEGYFISPSYTAPLVVLIHDWDGLTDYEVKRAQMLADAGYAVFAADLFGAGVRPTEVKDKRQHTGELYKDREKMRALLNGALAVAKGKGADVSNAVAAGYCFGGAAVLEWARSGADLKGFATFHGGLKTPAGQDYSQARGKVLVMHGTADKAISMDQFASLAVELRRVGLKNTSNRILSTPTFRRSSEKSWGYASRLKLLRFGSFGMYSNNGAI